MQWVKDNWMILWPVVTAIASLLYKLFDEVPRVHAFFSLLAGMGLDLPKILETLQRLFSGRPPAGGAGNDNAGKPADPSSFPKKPAVMRLATAAMIALSVCAITVTTGCASFFNNPVYVAQQLSQYVTAFIQTAQTIWNSILPMLGSNAAADTVIFDDAIASLETANSLLMDAVQAYQAGKGGINLPQLIQAVQDAVAKVLVLIQQFETSAKAQGYAVADSMGTLERMAVAIRHWEVQQ